jgi:hypothetical protein
VTAIEAVEAYLRLELAAQMSESLIPRDNPIARSVDAGPPG